jgi:polysaccharide chain length determinant protein (PEP-CTERM system associated)
MLPGKKYTPDDFLRMAWNRRWFIMIPLVVVALATAVVSMFLPNRYRASTSILVIPQRVPEEFVQSTVTADLGQRINTISTEILSRTRLERILTEFNLYERERTFMIMEDVVERMRGDINLNVPPPARRGRDQSRQFTIGFESSDPRTAMRVTERLASLFVQENIQDRSLVAEQTNQFLQAQLEEARRRLIEHERKLQEFRQRNNGQLPDQVLSNRSMMQGSQTQLATTLESINRDRDRLLALERSLAEAPPAVTILPAAPMPEGTPLTAAQQLESAKNQLAALLLRLKPEHPDIGRAKRVVAELEAKAEAEALAQPLSQTSPSPAVIRDRAEQARAESTRREIDELRTRIDSGKREAARFQANIDAFKGSVQAAPGLESQLTELMRDYTTLQEGYTTLLKKAEESKIAVDLERRQIGEQFRMIDAARLPERPISPDRVRINMLGLLAGLGLGVALVGLLEYRDTSFKTDDDIVTTLALPVIAVIPAMTSAVERRAYRRRKILLAASVSVVCMMLAGAVMAVWRLRLVEAWLR